MSNHVMLVEDNVSFRKVMKFILNATLPSVKVSEADGERKALDVCKSDMPHLILMDLKLADGSGLALTPKIKELSPGTVIVVVTNHDSQEYENAAYQSGADGFISKRYASPGEIVELVKSIAGDKIQDSE
jgi:DNA-binding NarL/FixJ family response regulator